MSGGGGGGMFSRYTPEKLQKEIRSAQQQAVDAEFETQLVAKLNELLASFNSRDSQKVNERLENILTKLEQKTGDEFDVRLGGSVAKHTYVDGLSDVDALLLVDETKLEDRTPASALKYLETRIRNIVGQEADVSAGVLAVTVVYKDKEKMTLQLLPAMRSGRKFMIASQDGQEWSEINPKKFMRDLTSTNERCEKRLVPTIKLIKAINAQLPERSQMKGYHIEAMAVNAFKKYNGEYTLPKMLEYFFGYASVRVNTPTKDKTGQSTHVDSYLGRRNNMERQQLSHLLSRIQRRMQNATASQLQDQWIELFGE